MDSNCRKLGETPYRECRKQAAIYNDALGSMERAAEMLGVSVNTLSNYELGVTVPPVNIIIVMADLYRAPQLKTMYCKNECLIGRCMPVAVDAGNIDNIVLRIIKQFKESKIESLKDAIQKNRRYKTMKKLFISQPMKGKSDEDILAERKKAIKSAEDMIGEPVEVIDSFFQEAPVDAKQKTEEYYEAKMKEMQESFEKEKADLIQAFENSEDAELEEEADQSEVVPANITVKEITEETEVD